MKGDRIWYHCRDLPARTPRLYDSSCQFPLSGKFSSILQFTWMQVPLVANSVIHHTTKETHENLLIINIILKRKDVSTVAAIVLPNILSDLASYRHTIVKGTAPIRARAAWWPIPRIYTSHKRWCEDKAFDDFHLYGLELLKQVNLWDIPQHLIDLKASSRFKIAADEPLWCMGGRVGFNLWRREGGGRRHQHRFSFFGGVDGTQIGI